MQNLILIGQPGGGKYEYLQLAAIFNNALIFELNLPKFGDPLKFARVFKQTLISVVHLSTQSYVIINDMQLKDPVYIDYCYNFINNLCHNETSILFDDEFKKSLIDIEMQLITNPASRAKAAE